MSKFEKLGASFQDKFWHIRQKPLKHFGCTHQMLSTYHSTLLLRVVALLTKYQKAEEKKTKEKNTKKKYKESKEENNKRIKLTEEPKYRVQ